MQLSKTTQNYAEKRGIQYKTCSVTGCEERFIGEYFKWCSQCMVDCLNKNEGQTVATLTPINKQLND